MKIIIIGNADSGWVHTTIQNTIDLHSNEIYVLSYENKLYTTWYELNGVHVVLIPSYRVWKFKTWLASMLLRRNFRDLEFDLLIVHSVRKDYLIIAKHLMPQIKRKVAAFWGSDMFRADARMIKTNKRYLESYDGINITTDAMLEKFHEQYGTYFDEKINRARFGLFALDNLDNHLSAQVSEAYFPEIPRNKVIVAIGYNGNQAQQHHAVLREIERLDKKLLSEMHLVLRMTYGTTKEYIESVRNVLDTIPCTSTVLTDFFSDDESAALTCLTDVMIHAQTTDAMSAAILEHIYAGALVMNPTWISYRELENENSCDVKYSSFEELGSLLPRFIKKKEEILSPEDQEKHRRIVKEIASWENNRRKWECLYYGK